VVPSPDVDAAAQEADAPAKLPPDLAAALDEPEARPLRELARLVLVGARAQASLLAVVAVCASFGVIAEAVLLRGVFDIGHELGVAQQRLGAAGALVSFLVLLLLLELPLVTGAQRLGRRLEARLRVSFLSKVPRLGDRYFASRPVSDMAARSHATHGIRRLPDLAIRLARVALELLFTAAGLVWLDPQAAPFAVLGALGCVAVPLATYPSWLERDLRMQSHDGALSRFYLDALVAFAPIRAHGAQRNVAREHESLVVTWAVAARDLTRAFAGAEAATALVGTVLAAWLLARHVQTHGDPAGALLTAYWALNFPALGQELGVVLRQVPEQRNKTLRLLEPLLAPEEADTGPKPPVTLPGGARGARIGFQHVTVLAGGNRVLEDVDLIIAPGTKVAVLGASGAGKSSFLGVLLGLHRASTGRVFVDGTLLEGDALRRVRNETAWLDPSVQLWNRTVTDNVLYGTRAEDAHDLPSAVDDADLGGVLDRLPRGLETPLGEGGALVSGGEGQRVRFARALVRASPSLVLFDEPFRGLDREARHALLARARKTWPSATFLCVTHDVREASGFDRVLVFERGRVVEDGSPADLAGRAGSLYADMLADEAELLEDVWSGSSWRRVRVEGGRILEEVSVVSTRASSRRADRGHT
jgi:ATP-binding cassette subfamily B protein